MRVLVISDGIGEIDAATATHTVSAAWHQAARDDVDQVPVSGGGPGFLSAISNNLPGAFHLQTVAGPLGDPTPASMYITGSGSEKTAYIEVAQICGLHLVDPGQRDPRRTTTRGVGEMLKAAVAANVSRIVVGLGGSATNDAGAGMLAALGAGPRRKLGRGPLSLTEVSGADLTLGPVREMFTGIDLIAACATTAPLAGFTGASGAYSQNKGASRAVAQQLERALAHFAQQCEAALRLQDTAETPVPLVPSSGPTAVPVSELKTLPGAGSGGGLGFGLGLLGARILSGTEVVAAALDINRRAAKSDLVFVITDYVDATTLGDGPIEIAVAAARSNALATVVLTQRLDAGNRELATAGISAAYELFDTVSGVENSDELLVLTQRVHRIARSWTR